MITESDTDAEDAMARGEVAWTATTSVDGFNAGPDDAMDRVFRPDEPNPIVDEIILTASAVLAGRRSYAAVELEPVSVTRAAGVTDFTLRVVKQG